MIYQGRGPKSLHMKGGFGPLSLPITHDNDQNEAKEKLGREGENGTPHHLLENQDQLSFSFQDWSWVKSANGCCFGRGPHFFLDAAACFLLLLLLPCMTWANQESRIAVYSRFQLPTSSKLCVLRNSEFSFRKRNFWRPREIPTPRIDEEETQKFWKLCLYLVA